MLLLGIQGTWLATARPGVDGLAISWQLPRALQEDLQISMILNVFRFRERSLKPSKNPRPFSQGMQTLRLPILWAKISMPFTSPTRFSQCIVTR
jgi:hypothetical protein